jgi:predicted nucleotidyltransferase
LDPRYQEFLDSSESFDVLGQQVPVASLKDVARGKIWAWSDTKRRASKRKKDELDLMRILESYPELRSMMPDEIKAQVSE